MIHYHGTPITPNSVLTGLTGRHFFVSYCRPDNIAVVSEIASSFAIDNGAFSAFTKEITIDWSKYADFISKWGSLPNMDFHVVPDVIGGSWQENMKMIEGWTMKRSAPVWHMGEPLEMARELSESFDILCIGGNMGQSVKVGSTAWWNSINELMEVVCDDGIPRCKLHGLGLLDPHYLLRSIPFHSADSTNLGRNLTQNGMSRGCAALVFADRIESTQASLRWQGIPAQQFLMGS